MSLSDLFFVLMFLAYCLLGYFYLQYLKQKSIERTKKIAKNIQTSILKTKKGYEILSISTPNQKGIRIGLIADLDQKISIEWSENGDAYIQKTRVPSYDL